MSTEDVRLTMLRYENEKPRLHRNDSRIRGWTCRVCREVIYSAETMAEHVRRRHEQF